MWPKLSSAPWRARHTHSSRLLDRVEGVSGAFLTEIRWTDVLDVVLVAAFIWAAFAWLRQTRSRLALLGVVLLSGLYLAARQLDLQLTVWILQGFFAVLVFVLVVVFQDDLRRIFERIAILGLRRRASKIAPDVGDALIRAVARQARDRTGALYVIPGRESLGHLLDGGIELDARLSEPLLLALFDRHTPTHDGAAVVSGARVERVAAHLPLSTQKIRGGTRHAAALGLAERSDALCVVVSEERGTVSVARDGQLRRLADPDQLAGELRDFLSATAAAVGESASWRGLLRRWPEALAAMAAAIVMWLVLVPGTGTDEVIRKAPVVVDNLPAGYRLVGVEPPEVHVTLAGPRLSFFRGTGDVRVRVDAVLVELGRRTFRLSAAQVEHPSRLDVITIEPDRVKLSVEREDEAADPPEAEAPTPDP